MSTGRSKPTRMTMRMTKMMRMMRMRTRMRTRMMRVGVGMLTDIDSIFLLWNRPTIFHLTLKRSRFQTILRTRIKKRCIR
jgi:hypothetical protein